MATGTSIFLANNAGALLVATGRPKKLTNIPPSRPFVFWSIRVAMKKLHLNKYKIFVASNQPDISRGNLQEKDLNYFNDLISSKPKIPNRNIYICKHDNHHNCQCRKPKPGMLNKILNDFNLNLDETCFIGDSHKDLEAASSINMKFIYLKTPYNSYPKNQVEIIHSLKDLQINI